MKLKSLLCLLACTLSFAAVAQTTAWPQKPVTIVVPFPAGGAIDMLGRALASHMQSALGQPFVVENRPGATGTIAFGQVKRAPADGYTLVVGPPAPFAVVPHLFKNLNFDPGKDFDLLTVAVQVPNVLVVPASSPHKSVAELIAHARAHPVTVTFASSGNGASDHLSAALFLQKTGTTGLHVPYKGGAPAINDLLGGQVDASFQNVNAVIQHIESGRLRALALTGDKRSAVLPNVPTMAEVGVKDLVVFSWQGVAAPKGLTAEVKQRVRAALMAALHDPQVADKFTKVGVEIVASTPEQFATLRQKESARWKQVIETARITAE